MFLQTEKRRRLLGTGHGLLLGGGSGVVVPSLLLTDLVSYWNLDEASGIAVDAHSTNDLTDNNTVTTAAGKVGTARQFTAANSEYLSIASNASLQTGDIDFTVAGWAYLDDKAAPYRIVARWDSQLEYILAYINGSDRFELYYSADGGIGLGPLQANVLGAVSAATWYFFVFWHDAIANTLNLQINNGTADTVAHATGIFASSAPFTIGQAGAIQFHNGRIDEVGFWKRVLTADERTALYAGGSGLAYPFS